MTPEEHARVKAIFMEACDLPENKARAFVEQEANGNAAIAEEVLSLLEHRSPRTILPARESTETYVLDTVETVLPEAASPNESNSKTRPGETTKLVLSGLWKENRDLLQQRLWVFALTLGVLIGYSLIRDLFLDSATWERAAQVSCLVVNLACIFFLQQGKPRSLAQLRAMEVLITANVGVLAAAADLRQMYLLGLEGDAVKITSASLWNYITWSLLILTYGVFIPNTWQRAASILLPMAFVPYLVEAVARNLHPVLATQLAKQPFDLPLPLPFVAAGIAISAARVIHSARLAAFRAKRFAQYELVAEIGAGGMGKVYEARHVLLKRPCAIKIVHPERTDERNLISFEREVRATSQLTHPHTVEVYDFGQTNEGLFFYVMEMLPGVNLRDLVRKHGPLPPGRVIYFLRQICGALQEAHDLGMVHRDIKPANIFASQRGGIYDYSKLLDFGLVRETGARIDLAAGPGKATAGTPDYMSPEQIIDFHNIDGRSDLYSLGATAYYLLVGRPPFERRDILSVLMAHTKDPVTPPFSIRPAIGTELNQIVMRCLEKSVEDRYQSALDLENALAACSQADTWGGEQARQWWFTNDGPLLSPSRTLPKPSQPVTDKTIVLGDE